MASNPTPYPAATSPTYYPHTKSSTLVTSDAVGVHSTTSEPRTMGCPPVAVGTRSGGGLSESYISSGALVMPEVRTWPAGSGAWVGKTGEAAMSDRLSTRYELVGYHVRPFGDFWPDSCRFVIRRALGQPHNRSRGAARAGV